VTTLPRFLLAALVASLAACAQPAIESAGGRGGVSNGTGGRGGGSGGSKGGGTDGPDFTTHYGDAGVSEVSTTFDPDDKSCAGELFQGKLVPLDLLLLLDISGSMEESAMAQSKWAALRDALGTFIKDPKSAGLGVGMETFPPPSKTCAKDGDCGAGYCEEKGVCNTAQNVATTEVACNDNGLACANEGPCTKYGLCAKSGLRCVGAACGAGDTCSPRPKFCVVPNAGCDATAYETPIVPIADLPGAVPALEMAMAGIVAQGTTPTTPAVTGALAHLRARAMANPNRKPVLVLATDGLPTECGFGNSVNAAAMALRTGQMGMPAIPTYVIGIFGANQIARSRPALETMATAGGTGMPFVLTTGNDLSQRLLDAVNQIRGSALGCEFTIPKPTLMAGSNLDFDHLNVRVKSKAGIEDLLYVGGMAGCDPVRGGWYYDADPKTADPTRVLLCEASCKKVKMPQMAGEVSVELRVGCKTIIK
jgi:hypothetical protein